MEDAVDRVLTDKAITATTTTTNGESHLPTPALSPITEHGTPPDGHEQPDENPLFPGGEARLDVTPKRLPIKAEDAEESDSYNNDSISPGSKPVSLDTNDARNGGSMDNKTLKLSPAQIYQLTSSPGSIPLRAGSPILEDIPLLNGVDQALKELHARPATTSSAGMDYEARVRPATTSSAGLDEGFVRSATTSSASLDELHIRPATSSSAGLGIPPAQGLSLKDGNGTLDNTMPLSNVKGSPSTLDRSRPTATARSISSPVIRRKHSAVVPRNPIDGREPSRSRRPTLAHLKVSEQAEQADGTAVKSSPFPDPAASNLPPPPSVLPLPPLSLPTYLQLELSSDRPSALYIHRPSGTDIPYESSKVKFERLLNFLLLPPKLEQTLIFGALACLDAWLYTFTILPLRFCKAVLVWLQWGFSSLITEVKDIAAFIYNGIGRLRQRQRQASLIASRNPSISDPSPLPTPTIEPTNPRLDLRIDESASGQQRPVRRERRASGVHRHKRTRSTPSALLPNHKADLLQGFLIIFSCMILLRFDASRIYHNIRGQSAIKLYVIYNSLEVFDRLFSAIGQDVLECLFSKETLERKPNGRSKVIRPFWMFVLALAYNVIHAAALFYQVITLNVAVNSYSNALLTLLMSNQFVEIKGSVFKKLEKENLFQMTCADVVERFQLWLMLLIIALRNIVEVGGFSMNVFGTSSSSSSSSSSVNATGPSTQSMAFLPQAFTLVPKWSGQVLGPFLIVLGSEMLVDWLKHAYINKFNSIKPDIYERFLDVLAKDYYSNAFVDQNLMKRLGLPVLPLACLFIRASVQTYHMFVATHMPLPLASTATALAVESASAETSPATTAALAHIDLIFRRALGRSSFGAGVDASGTFSWWSVDDVIALATMLVFFLVLYLFLLAFKLVLGMCLLSFARSRYKGMREREKQGYDAGARRLGGWGAVEVDEDKRKWIYEDDEEGLRALKAKEAKAREKKEKVGGELKLDGVGRYMMVAKRIW